MKKLIPVILFGALMAGSVAVVAGPRGHGDCDRGFDGGKRMERMVEQLDLSEEQVAALQVLREEKRANGGNKKAMKGRRGDGGVKALDPYSSDYETQVEALADAAAENARARVVEKAATHKAFLDILTEEQRDKFAELRAERKANKGR